MTEAPAAPRARLIALVQQIIGGASPDPFPIEQKLSELGLSSLKMVNLMLAVEMDFDIVIPQQEITPENFFSVASVESLVIRLKSGGGA
jgi:acyl carrier protein